MHRTPLGLRSGAQRQLRTRFGLVIAMAVLLVWASPAAAAKPSGAGGGGAAGGGSSGAVKVVDADTGAASDTDNEPHVCAFYLTFEGAPSAGSGSWWIVDWPPTGSGAEILSGSYTIPPGGSTSTATFDLAAGHYRVEWQADGDGTRKHKTFWVDTDCTADEPESPPGDPESPPADEPSEELIEEPVQEPTNEPIGEPVADPVDVPAEDPADAPGGEPLDEAAEDPVEEPADDESAELLTEGEVLGATDASEAQPAATGQPDGGLASGAVGEPIVEELPDSAMAPPDSRATLGAELIVGLTLGAAVTAARRRPSAR